MSLASGKNLVILCLSTAVWFFCACMGIAKLTLDASIPGSVCDVTKDGLEMVEQIEDANQFRLLVFMHPKCPCSRATLEALNQIVTRAAVPPTIQFHFYKPGDAPDAWAETDLWHSAAQMKSAAVHIDRDGLLAARLGAQTSGLILLYSPRGKLLFQGGVTPARGHRGANGGFDAVVDLLNARPGKESKWHVFGCPLKAPQSAVADGAKPCDS